ncbi:MAG TPA: DUF2007 domain-containing protein [Pseudoxanthomonas sp.]|nr:DUF2007 domain-containing protein [Pseudoxanthomonas sp.]
MFVAIASFLDPLEARIVLGRLSAEGIDAYVADEHQAINDWYMRQALGGVKVRVRTDQIELARGILRDLEAGKYLDAAESRETVPQAVSTGSLSRRLAFLGFFALGLPLPWRREPN